jgi:hypothetical protein
MTRKSPPISKDERKRVALAMRELVGDPSAYDRRGWRFLAEAYHYESCGDSTQVVQCEACTTKFRVDVKCKSRICEDCGRLYYRQIVKPLREVIALMLANKRKGFAASMVTLTVTTKRFGDRMPSREDIARIYSESTAFFRLFCGRYRGVFTKAGKVREDRKRWLGAGSISVLEVGSDNNNLHIHALCYMPYVHQSILKRAWSKITGDSFHVDIRAAYGRSAQDLAWYILKYVTKPPASESYSGIAKYAWMIKGSRRLRSSGMFYNHVRRTVSVDKLPFNCAICGGHLLSHGAILIQYVDSAIKSLWDAARAVINEVSAKKQDNALALG